MKAGYENLSTSKFWKALTVGDNLEGEIVDKVMIKTPEGHEVASYTLKKDDGELISTPSNVVLNSKLAKAAMGDKVYIEFTGEDMPKLKGHKPTKLFDVGIKKKK